MNLKDLDLDVFTEIGTVAVNGLVYIALSQYEETTCQASSQKAKS